MGTRPVFLNDRPYNRLVSGLDTDKATDGPTRDEPGVAKTDSLRGGHEAVSAVCVAKTVPAAEGIRAEPPVITAVPPVPPLRAASPWRHARRTRAARQGATAPGARAARRLLRGFAVLRLPTIAVVPAKVWALWLGGALALGWLGATAVHPVGPHQQAIVSTFGAAGATLGPGLAPSWPWPVGSAVVEDVTSVRHLTSPAGDGDGEALMLTRDASLVDVAFDVRWRIRDLRRYQLGLANPDLLMRQNADTAMRGSVAEMDFADAIGPARNRLAAQAARQLQALLDRDQAGVIIDGIDLHRSAPPARIAEAMRAVVAARNDAANETVQARSWSNQLIIHARGEAGAFDKIYAQYRLAPEVTRRQMYYATMERVLSQSDKVIVDAPGTVTTLPPLPGGPTPAAGSRAGNGH